MPKRIHLVLRLTSGLFIFSGFLALLTTEQYGWDIMAGAAVLWLIAPLGERLDARFSGYRIATNMGVLLCVLILLLQFSWETLPQAVTYLIMLIAAYRMVHLKGEHEYNQLYLMSFFLVLAACAQFPNAGIGLVLPLHLISAVWAFLALQMNTEYRRVSQDTPIYLVSLRVSRSGTTIEHRLNSYRGVWVSGAVLSLASILLTIGVFVMTPRVGGSIFSVAGIGEAPAVTGLSDSVRLTSGGTITEDLHPVMRVGFPEEPGGRYAGPLYWRSTAFSYYFGDSWDVSDEDELFEEEGEARTREEGRRRPRERRRNGEEDQIRESASEKDGRGLLKNEPGDLERTRRGRGTSVRQKILWQDAYRSWLPSLPYPWRVVAPRAPIVWGLDGTLELRRDVRTENQEPGLEYSVWSDVYQPSSEELRRCGANYWGNIPSRTLRTLLSQNLGRKSLDIVGQITEGKTTVYDKVVAIQDWFSGNGFYYSLSTPKIAGDRPIDAFITRTRVGHCELYASAMALMVRSMDVPARVVSGFRGGEWDPKNQLYTVRANMAHLWVEVYFLGYGWATFDPSPSEEGLQSSSENWFSRQAGYYAMRAKMVWYQYVIGYNPRQIRWGIQGFGKRVAGVFRLLSTANLHAESGESSGMRGGTKVWVVTGTSGALVAAFGWLRWRRRRRRSQTLSPDQWRAARLYRRLIRMLERRGTECEGKTAEDVALALAQAPNVNGLLLKEILAAYSESRFGGRPLPPSRYRALSGRMRRLWCDVVRSDRQT